MIGLVIVTHGGLASEFLSAMEHVVGPQRGVAAICIGPEDDMERRRRDIVEAAQAVEEGAGKVADKLESNQAEAAAEGRPGAVDPATDTRVPAKH